MINILSSVASNAPVIDAISQNSNLRMIAVQNGGFDALDQCPELKQPGIYACVAENNRIYVGYGGSVVARAHRYTQAPARPPLLVFIVGNDQPLTLSEAAALERIVFQAFSGAGHSFFNRDEPFGAPIDLATYAKLQCDWASLMPPLSQIVPALACPWIEPSHVRIPKADPIDAYHEEYFVAEKRGLRGVLKRVRGGYLILPGSIVRCEPIRSAGNLCHVMRIESQYCGLLVPDRDHLRLTRPVYRRTLASCSRFVFTTGEASIWEPIRDQLPPCAA